MNDTKIQWHPGFIAAMQLELKENRDSLIFEKEYNLNTKPLEIDLLIIKKEASVHISNEIGKFFKGHNILEYKSPGDHLDIDTFFKVFAYASLYKSYSETTDGVPADDITISIIRESKPEGLFQYFREHSCQINRVYKGIYYIKGPFPFPAQIITTKELDKRLHTWLRALSRQLNEDDLQELLGNVGQIKGKSEREMADSILEVSIKANRKIVEKLMGDEHMCNALMEIMEPQLEEMRKESLQEGRKEGRKEGLEEGVQKTINILRKLKHKDEEIRALIIEQYGLTEKMADGYLHL